MEKCHCAQVKFEAIVQTAISEGKDYRDVVKACGAAETCTACKEYLIAYCEDKLQLAPAQ
ncbi:hypothetical protein LEP1GSC050_3316 [Leptospira broomii serovar Hurstbridge str. 5399]|uniref:2Fe-2S iron-sulfur cluster-binding domain protein n=3 Tax=Leptospira TaxID=171 RepID=V6H944_9LEPT|nr:MULTISPECIES: hypothetical protein [Leptospira]EQA35382.1 hypothetical protein LEP1GSC047_1486 [Leptospira inadai serovar Lyme str. 10]EQA45551.1 hypothetical protein LEP1GSC050_3316 [Leptospira broomii serovar Hurstbridge str. 5399]PNV75369.1 hypothetical protein BES34_008925 [Leptospira inadai serovar Lyme]